MIDKVIKWHETKDIALANEICEDLYELYSEMYNKGIFKEENLPTNCIYEWLAKCRDIEETMNKAKRVMDTDFGKAAINTLHNLFILEPVNFYQLIKDGKLDRDCSILENRLDDMRNNALFMLSHQFRIA